MVLHLKDNTITIFLLTKGSETLSIDVKFKGESVLVDPAIEGGTDIELLIESEAAEWSIGYTMEVCLIWLSTLMTRSELTMTISRSMTCCRV